MAKKRTAFELIVKTIQSNPKVEPNEWFGACWAILVNGSLESGRSYEDFCKQYDHAKEHCKPCWEIKE